MRLGKQRGKKPVLVSEQVRGIVLLEGEWSDMERDKHKRTLTLEHGFKAMVADSGESVGPMITDLSKASEYAHAVSQITDWTSDEPMTPQQRGKVLRMWWAASGKEMTPEGRAEIDRIDPPQQAVA